MSNSSGSLHLRGLMTNFGGSPPDSFMAARRRTKRLASFELKQTKLREQYSPSFHGRCKSVRSAGFSLGRSTLADSRQTTANGVNSLHWHGCTSFGPFGSPDSSTHSWPQKTSFFSTVATLGVNPTPLTKECQVDGESSGWNRTRWNTMGARRNTYTYTPILRPEFGTAGGSTGSVTFVVSVDASNVPLGQIRR